MGKLALVASCIVALTLAVGGTAAAADDPWSAETIADNEPATFDWSQLIQPPLPDADLAERQNFARFTESLANESWSEAEIAAKQSVEYVVDDAENASYAHARALHNLAITQQFMGKHEAAIQNYQAAIEYIVSAEHNLSTALILPLRGLAFAYSDINRPDRAAATFDRVLHVSNVNYGPHSLQQVPILEARMDQFFESDDVASALDVLDRISMLYTREYPRLSEELIPSYKRQVEIYGRLGMYADERTAWRKILMITRENKDENDLALIEPHIRLAENLVREMRKNNFRSVSTSSAEKHLKRALSIAESKGEDQWKVKVDCLLALADFYTLFDMHPRAHRYYTKAWERTSSNHELLAFRDQVFSSPVPLAQNRPDPYAEFVYVPGQDHKPKEDYLQGQMTVQFSVNERGRTRDLHILEANPPRFSHMERRARNAVENFIFRPRYVDGQATNTSDQVYEVEYFYRESQYQASLRKMEEKARTYRSRRSPVDDK